MKTKKKVLIVGGTGFIGYWLAKSCLKKNFQVFSISTTKPKQNRFIKNVNYILSDIRNKKDLVKKIPKNLDYVVNLGGYVNHEEKLKTYQSHYTGCKNLVEIFKKKHIKLFIQMGSSVENSNLKSPQYEILTNKVPKFGYNLAKYSATKYLLNQFKKHKFPVIILRLYQAYGPYQDINRLIPFVINECLEKKEFPF